MSLLQISHLHKSFAGVKAVNDISITLEKGKILAILGESGSGKTTLLHLIAALYEPDEGTLTLAGERITPPSEKLIAGHPDIKLVRQDYGLFPNISIRENIAYELRYYVEDYRNERVDKLLQISGLEHVQHHLPRQVSGGEQQRAVIARAIAEEPKLLLMDEPFSHLDAVNKRRLKEEVLNLIKAEGVSCIFVTHDVADAYGMADVLMIMQRGSMLQIGNPEEVYKNPANQYVAEITGEINPILPFLHKEISNVSIKFIRPEQIYFKPDSDLRATVENIRFLGAYYEIILKNPQSLLKMYSFEKFNIGEDIGIEIKV
ncbi:ABC transporter related protein [Emticicia oligotrophica DSM 17448]|uniref:ABC transporter related protein n=1 Tax=Emticicia oligotrophica (strain DSM 17448 / CIP 109782 / MTCC 6937 / GPTSA100-15) TaxID=929562 RepID=A0ABN4AJQ9_EMTOG|nr:ABC transporter ATP-binding protein [Emticicia oligotrophica]AFK02218.1 ABC transporter related protein [Emticicia oligotrophica DSM 17448]